MRASTAPCTGMGTTNKAVAGHRSLAVRSMSARAELGTLVSRAIRLGQGGNARLRSGSNHPCGASRVRTRSNCRITALRPGRTSRICTVKLARAAQKLSLPTTITASPSSGMKSIRASWDAQITPEMEASPSVRVSQRWPFLIWGRLAVASSRKRGAKPRSSNVPMA